VSQQLPSPEGWYFFTLCDNIPLHLLDCFALFEDRNRFPTNGGESHFCLHTAESSNKGLLWKKYPLTADGPVQVQQLI